MNIRHASLALLLTTLTLTGCSAAPRPAPGTKESSSRRQIDEGGYVLKDMMRIERGWAFGLKRDERTMHEYWLKSSIWPREPESITIERAPVTWSSCSSWRKAHCKDPGLRCFSTSVPRGGSRDSFCKGSTPPSGTNFFWDGEYTLISGDGGRVYVGERHEIWSMRSLITNTGTLSPTSLPKGFLAFKEQVCGEQMIIFEPSYTELPDFCTNPPPDCR